MIVGPQDAWQSAGGLLPADAILLAIDTSTRAGGVALCRGVTVLGEETWLSGGHQTSQVLPSAARLWSRAGLSARDLQGVVVATGPGSFTGLRVGASLGKGFAIALGVPLVGVPTLDVVAYQHRHLVGPLWAVANAGRGQLYVARYRCRNGQVRRLSDFNVLTVDELAAEVARSGRRPFIGGELDTPAVATLRQRLLDKVRLASPAASLRRPAYLAELGRWHLAGGTTTDAASLQPLYLRRGASTSAAVDSPALPRRSLVPAARTPEKEPHEEAL